MTKQEIEELFADLLSVRDQLGKLKDKEDKLKDKLKFYMKYKDIKSLACNGYIAKITKSKRRTLDPVRIAATLRMGVEELKEGFSSVSRYESFMIKKEKTKK